MRFDDGAARSQTESGTLAFSGKKRPKKLFL
jgi:hypothetical protein